MRLLLLGKRGSITHWLEDAADAFCAGGHQVRLGIVRNPRLARGLERALLAPIADRIAASARHFRPDLVLAIGGFHVPRPILERINALPNRPPLVGWVGDNFGEEAGALAGFFDLVAYADSGLARRHVELGLPSPAIFAPHAVDPRRAEPAVTRTARMVFVASPTPHRRAVVEQIANPIVLHGLSWNSECGHDVHARRLPARKLIGVYAHHIASLNIRNEINVLSGLNQRNFQPYLAGTPLVTDDQGDLPLCFEPGIEAFVWRDITELNDIYTRLLDAPEEAARVGEAGRARVLAEHTYERRLTLLSGAVGAF